MKKTVYIINENSTAAASGIGTYINEYIHCLRQLDYSIIRIELNTELPEFTCIEEDGIKRYAFPYSENMIISPKYYKRVACIFRLCIKDSVQNIFHINYMHSEPLVKYLRLYFPLSKVKLTIHYMDWTWLLKGNIQEYKKVIQLEDDKIEADSIPQKVLIYHEELKNISKKVDRIVVLSKDSFKCMNEIVGIPNDKIEIIPNGLQDCYSVMSIDDKNELRKKYHVLQDEKLFLYVGRFDKMKGILNLLNAFQIVIKSYPNSRLIIAGPIDNLPDEIMKAAKDVWAKITLTGKLSAKELSVWYKIADIGIMASYAEQCSYVGIEMMMYGMPVVASDSFGVRNMFNNHNAIIAPIIDYEVGTFYSNNLATSMIRLLSDRALSVDMAKKSRKTYESFYTIDKMRVKYEKLLMSLR